MTTEHKAIADKPKLLVNIVEEDILSGDVSKKKDDNENCFFSNLIPSLFGEISALSVNKDVQTYLKGEEEDERDSFLLPAINKEREKSQGNEVGLPVDELDLSGGERGVAQQLRGMTEEMFDKGEAILSQASAYKDALVSKVEQFEWKKEAQDQYKRAVDRIRHEGRRRRKVKQARHVDYDSEPITTKVEPWEWRYAIGELVATCGSYEAALNCVKTEKEDAAKRAVKKVVLERLMAPGEDPRTPEDVQHDQKQLYSAMNTGCDGMLRRAWKEQAWTAGVWSNDSMMNKRIEGWAAALGFRTGCRFGDSLLVGLGGIAAYVEAMERLRGDNGECQYLRMPVYSNLDLAFLTHDSWPSSPYLGSSMIDCTILGPAPVHGFAVFSDEIWCPCDFRWLDDMGFRPVGQTPDFAVYRQDPTCVFIKNVPRWTCQTLLAPGSVSSMSCPRQVIIDLHIVDQVNSSKPGTNTTKENCIRQLDCGVLRDGLYGPGTKKIILDSVVFALNMITYSHHHAMYEFNTTFPTSANLSQTLDAGRAAAEVLTGMGARACDRVLNVVVDSKTDIRRPDERDDGSGPVDGDDGNDADDQGPNDYDRRAFEIKRRSLRGQAQRGIDLSSTVFPDQTYERKNWVQQLLDTAKHAEDTNAEVVVEGEELGEELVCDAEESFVDMSIDAGCKEQILALCGDEEERRCCKCGQTCLVHETMVRWSTHYGDPCGVEVFVGSMSHGMYIKSPDSYAQLDAYVRACDLYYVERRKSGKSVPGAWSPHTFYSAEAVEFRARGRAGAGEGVVCLPENEVIDLITQAARMNTEAMLALSILREIGRTMIAVTIRRPLDMGVEDHKYFAQAVAMTSSQRYEQAHYSTGLYLSGNDALHPVGHLELPVPIIQTPTLFGELALNGAKVDICHSNMDLVPLRSQDDIRIRVNHKRPLAFGHTTEIIYQCFMRKAYMPSAYMARWAIHVRLGKPIESEDSIITIHEYQRCWKKLSYWFGRSDFVDLTDKYEMAKFVANQPAASRKKYIKFLNDTECGKKSFDDVSEAGSCFAKTDEVLSKRTARIICNPKPATFCMLQPIVQGTAANMAGCMHHEIANNVFFTYGAKTVQIDRDAWYQGVLNYKEDFGVFVIAAGDDNIVAVKNRGRLKWYEGDVTACDQSHGHRVLMLVRDCLHKLLWPGNLIEIVMDGYLDSLNGDCNVSFSTPQLHTGYPYTSFMNTLVVGMICCLAGVNFLAEGKSDYLDELRQWTFFFNMKWKLAEVDATTVGFLKGVFVGGHWSPLPSRIWKATMMRAQGNVTPVAVRKRIRNIALGLQWESLDPLMRTWCKKVLGPDHQKNSSWSGEWWSERCRMDRSLWLSRGGDQQQEQWMEVITRRYGVTACEYMRECQWFNDVYSLDGWFLRTSVVLRRLVERDYASDGQREFDHADPSEW